MAETLRRALEELALQGEKWLAALVTADWADRYGRPVRYDRLPRGKEALASWVLQVGEEGCTSCAPSTRMIPRPGCGS